jgi:hypothetical protein
MIQPSLGRSTLATAAITISHVWYFAHYLSKEIIMIKALHALLPEKENG